MQSSNRVSLPSLVQLWLTDYLVKVIGGKTPAVPFSETTLQPLARLEFEEAMSNLEVSTRNDQAALKKDCLQRDNFRCIFTGNFDRKSVRSGQISLPAGATRVNTRCAHILPFGLGDFNEHNAQEVKHHSVFFPLGYTTKLWIMIRPKPKLPFGGLYTDISQL